MSNQSGIDSLALAVLEAVAEREDTNVTDLPPLHNTIDSEALDKLFRPKYDGTPREGGYVAFIYAGYWVTVYHDGSVELSEYTE